MRDGGDVAYHSCLRQADGSYRIALGACSGLPDCVATREDADTPAVTERSHITVVPITWDRTYGYPIDRKRELAKLKTYVERRVPRR